MREAIRELTIVVIVFFAGFAFGMQYLVDKAEIKLPLETEVRRVVDLPKKTKAMPKRVSLGIYRVTSYCPCEKCCGIWATKGVDKDGDRVTPGNRKILPGDMFVAADPKLHKRGDWLTVPGYGIVEVRDVGGATKGNRLDVFFPTHQEALNFGVQHLEIFQID